MRNKRGREKKGACMALSKRTDIRRFSAAAFFAAATLNASPLYLAVLSEQTFSDPAWRAVAETLAARHGGEAVTYSGTAFPETLRATLAASRPDYVCFVAQPQEVTQAFVAKTHQMLRQLDGDRPLGGV